MLRLSENRQRPASNEKPIDVKINTGEIAGDEVSDSKPNIRARFNGLESAKFDTLKDRIG